MKKYESSRGWRNRNPLNIRRSGEWQGLAEKQTDHEFCRFMKMCFGYRAAVKVMKSYAEIFAKEGIEWNISNIIRHWTMHSGQDTEDYIRRVLELMHRSADNQRLAPIDTRPGVMQLSMLIAAMTCVETGCPPYAVPMGALKTGFTMAGVGRI